MPTVLVNGLPIYYDETGSGDPILWIQGLGADHTAWLGQVNAFRAAYRCVVFDNRDVGHSGQAASPYTVRDLAEDAARLIVELGLGAAHVVGLSMGGAVAQELALGHPEAVRSLTLVSSTARPDARLEFIVRGWAEIYLKVGAVDFYRHVVPWLFSCRFFEHPRGVAAFLRYSESHPQHPAAFARQASASLAHDITGRLAQIAAPTLVVAGEEDILVPPRFARLLATGIPGASLATIPAAGHAANVEQVVAFNQVLREFLAQSAPI